LITLGLVGGVIADRFDKRTILLVIQTWSLSIYLLMAVLLIGGWIQLWHLYVTALLLGIGMSMNQPVRTSLIPQLLEGKLLLNALALNSVAINVTRLSGPAAIGLLIAVADGNVAPAYVVGSAMYVLIIVSTALIDYRSERITTRGASILSDLAEGFRYLLYQNRTALALVVIAAGPLAFGHAYITLLPVLVTEVLKSGPSTFGLIQSIGAVGALTGGLTLATLGSVRNKGAIMLATGVTYGGSVILLGGVGSLVLAIVVVIVIGASQTVFRAANNSTLLEITPRRLQGRIVSITFLDTGIQSVAAILAGVVTDAFNVSMGMAFLGAMCLGIIGMVAIGAPTPAEALNVTSREVRQEVRS
jgi:MFS family permease